jgi:hypothetical protein
MSQPTERTLKVLFTRSKNLCAFTNCNSPIIEESDTVTGEICHIKGASPNGPRFDPTQDEAERHALANLLICCGRHHKLIDFESEKYTVDVLVKMKRDHELANTFEIDPRTAKVAKDLLKQYSSLVVHSNSGQIAVQSPGAIQANTINIKTTKSKLVIAPPAGSIGDDREKLAYVTYLIDRYQSFQKGDKTKVGGNKYIIIYNAIKREFKESWKLISITRFEELIAFLQKRIDTTKIGKINKAQGKNSYHSFDDHP